MSTHTCIDTYSTAHRPMQKHTNTKSIRYVYDLYVDMYVYSYIYVVMHIK